MEEKRVREVLDDKILAKESMLRQRVRNRHLNLGDCNLRYFYSLVNDNKKRSTICSIENNQGEICMKAGQMTNILVSHFEDILAI